MVIGKTALDIGAPRRPQCLVDVQIPVIAEMPWFIVTRLPSLAFIAFLTAFWACITSWQYWVVFPKGIDEGRSCTPAFEHIPHSAPSAPGLIRIRPTAFDRITWRSHRFQGYSSRQLHWEVESDSEKMHNHIEQLMPNTTNAHDACLAVCSGMRRLFEPPCFAFTVSPNNETCYIYSNLGDVQASSSSMYLARFVCKEGDGPKVQSAFKTEQISMIAFCGISLASLLICCNFMRLHGFTQVPAIYQWSHLIVLVAVLCHMCMVTFVLATWSSYFEVCHEQVAQLQDGTQAIAFACDNTSKHSDLKGICAVNWLLFTVYLILTPIIISMLELNN